MPKKKREGGLVYSTEFGRMCPACRQPAAGCRCRAEAPAPPEDGIVRVGRESKGRKGKGVTTISGLPLEPGALKQFARQLKQSCGSGGTVRNGVIEIQGDHRTHLVSALRQKGWTVKRTGG